MSSQDAPKFPDGSLFKHEAQAVRVNNEATSVRQLSEHGMQMIQGQFPRLKDNLQYEVFGERKIILYLMVLLYNFQTEKVGINQILNTFMSRTRGFESYGFTYKNNGSELHIVSERANAVFLQKVK